MPTTRIISDEELLQLPKDGSRYEVVNGELRVMSPAGWRHEAMISALKIRLGAQVEKNQLGTVLGSNAMYVLPSGNKRSPDLSFVATGWLTGEAGKAVFPELAPDLAVEIVSPSNTGRAVLEKVGEYLEAGVRLVWVIDPAKRRATAYRQLTSVRELDENGSLDGEDVVPGFRCALKDVLA